jgi:flagellar FliJ protein
MSRADRMQPVQRLYGEHERERARELGTAQRELAEAERRLEELRVYRSEYLGAFRKRAEQGASIRALRDFQAFLARLELALQQQEQLVAQAREQAAGSRLNWQGAAQQVKVVGSVLERWRQADALAGTRQDQKELDERALRAHAKAEER